jgi:asparagine synthase (glutamine-hydrolysing)
MCGIAGVMTRDGTPPAKTILDALEAALAHRGPDGRGRHVKGNVGLVQSRLAIIDLVTGDQPIYAPDGAALVANAEIYNYIELRDALAAVPFRTKSDCEPPLHLYLRDGPEFAPHLRGMYALAIHDPERGRLVLARDPFGIKPLYYAETGFGFAFASEPQALIAAGLATPSLRAPAVAELLQLQFTTGAETIFAGVYRVLPGETLIVEQGRIVARLLRPALPAGGPVEQTNDIALYDLDRLLNDAVGVHQRSDVPYGMFLSGGVDSSVLLAMMARLNPRPVIAFTAGFPGTGAHDEREHARAVAKAVGAAHVEVEVDAGDFWRLLPGIAAAVDDPAADYAVVPTYKLGQAARAAGIKVVLSGEGGDELFAGYGRYRRATRARLFGGRPMRGVGALHGLSVLRFEPKDWRAGIAAAEERSATPERTGLQAAQATDCADWLPNDLLTKLDRCLMAHGVEGRVPFLDPLLSDFAFRLPDRLKVRRGLGKWLLRRWLETGLPAAKPFSRKRGFTVPVGEWIAARGRELGPLVARQPGVAEVSRPGAVERLFATVADHGGGDHAPAAWHLLFYALWHRRHVLRAEPVGDAFVTLAATV